jgi:DNA-directed RNA polymerase III subunit RPC3
MLSSADNPSPSGKAASFVSLSASKVQVEFDIIHRRLRLQALETACRDKHGNEGVRVMRLLLEAGKMDEKQVKHPFPVASETGSIYPGRFLR